MGSYVVYPQKAPLILLTDRPVQLETPRHNFLSAFTPNAAFYVRWHLDEIPTTVDLSEWRLSVQGKVEKPRLYSHADLVGQFKLVSVAAVNQCSGNSRSRFQPRVPGGQWGNGAMGNALWTGVRLKELLDAAGVKKGAVEVQFEGMDRGKAPEGFGSHKYLKSLQLTHSAMDECVIAFQMNGEPLPMLNGFPARLVVPGNFATYWVKALTHIRVLDSPDENFWMKTAYRVPNTPRGNTTPGEMKAGKVKTLPMGQMPVRSFLITPDGSSKIPSGLPVMLKGIAFSGHDRVVKVEVSTDGGQVWRDARLAEDYGAFAFRAWDFMWLPERPGRHVLAVRATDGQGNIQPDDPVWNAGGYLWNQIERQEVVVG
ncbi:MAG TPA: molybdopterin-dependent oxidoreductase, partial [Candidatus Acidoferrales bacterium]|nr:molybdopterin-dependent oxidoreductase [Candidatus Acidoferrales bacterium]